MSKDKIVKDIHKKNLNLTKPYIEFIINTLNRSIKDALKIHRRIEIRGFGIFFIKKIKEKYSARNPSTGELIYVPEKNKIRFKPSKKLKTKINE